MGAIVQLSGQLREVINHPRPRRMVRREQAVARFFEQPERRIARRHRDAAVVQQINQLLNPLGGQQLVRGVEVARKEQGDVGTEVVDRTAEVVHAAVTTSRVGQRALVRPVDLRRRGEAEPDRRSRGEIHRVEQLAVVGRQDRQHARR